MNPMRSLFAVTLASIVASAVGPAVQAETAAVDPAAVKILKRMTDYMNGLQQFSARTQTTLEDTLEFGQRVDIDVAGKMVMRRPNKLRAERVGEFVDQAFYYDGKTLTFHMPARGYYATEKAPGTIEELLDYTRESLGLIIPAADLLYTNAYSILMNGVTSAAVLGKVVIGDSQCHHLAFRRPDIDFQIWVADGDKPLPCKYVVTDVSTPEMVSTVSLISDWNVAPAAANSEFQFVAPRGAKRIDFIPLGQTSAFGR